MGRRLLLLSQLYPSDAYPASGPFVRDQAVELARRHRVTVIAPLSATTAAERARVALVPAESEEDGLRVVRPRVLLHHIPVGGRTIGPPFYAMRLRPVLRRENLMLGGVDLVHAQFADNSGFAAARFAKRERLPFVLTVRGSDVLIHGKAKISKWFVEATLRQASAVITVSRQLADGVVALGADRRRVTVIPGGVPYQPKLEREEARQSLGVEERETILLWVGGLVPIKQPLDAVAAFVELSIPNGRLVIVGDGVLHRDVEDFVQQQGLEERVSLTGYLDRGQVWRWQCAADILINSSCSEGTPFAVLEALGAGTPVAAYPLPGVVDVLEEVDGGRVADASFPDQLAAAIKGVLLADLDREELARRARTRFSIAATVAKLEDVYAAAAD